MKTGTDLLAEARLRITEVGAAEALALHGKDGVVFLDVRDQHEVNLGRIPGAVHVSRGNLETKIEAVVGRPAEVVVYCASGNRSVLAVETLHQMGYEKVCSLAGGIRAWAEAGGDIDG